MSSNSTISATFKIVTDAKSFKDLVNSSDALKSAFNGAAVEAEKLPKRMGGALSDVSRSVAGLAAGFLSLKAAFSVLKDAVGTIKDFERANSELAAVLGTTTGEIEDMTQAAIDLGRNTMYSASEVTELQTALARLGFTKTQILDMQESVLKFAAAVGTDLGSAADFTGSALRAFGLDAKQSQGLLDMMAKSTTASALSFEKLQTSISVVAPVAHAFGLSAQDTVAFLGAMSNAGFDASSAATALRNILLNLADSNGKLAKGLGHTASTMPEIIDALRELRERGVDLNATLEMTDKRSVSAFNALLDGVDTVDALRDSLENCDGALEEMYGTMTDNLEGAVNSLKSAWEGLILSFKNSAGPLATVTNWLAKFVNALTDYASDDKQFEELIEGIRELNSGTGPEHTFTVTTPVVTPAGGNANAGGNTNAGGSGDGEKKKTKSIKGLTDAINDYRESVQRALEVNEVFNGGLNANDVQLDAMGSGLKSIVSKYGAESEAVQKLIAEYNDLLKARREASRKIPTLEAVGGIQGAVSFDITKPLDEYKKKTDAASLSAKEMGSVIGSLSGVVSSLGGALGDSAAQWASWAAGLISAIGKAMPVIAQMIAQRKLEATASAEAAATEGAAAVAGIPYVGPVMAVSAIASIIAALASIPKFAKGGLAYGPTLGVFGEYPGAANNPEVVAPLDKLRSIVREDVSLSGGKVKFRIEGRDLVGILETETNMRRRS